MEPEILIGEFDTLLLDNTGAKEGKLIIYEWMNKFICILLPL
jgi:hypothetical protein